MTRPLLSRIGRAMAATLAVLLALPALAQSAWPERPIRLVVPFSPGGSNDNIARVVAAKLGARLGQSVVVENRGGSGGTIGTEFVVRSRPDGYTLLFASSSLTTNAAMGKKLGYDPLTDLAPIGEIGTGAFVVAVGNAVPARTLAELLALARAEPGRIGYGSAGSGGINHLGTELLASAAKVRLLHVPYKGIAPAFTDLMAGNLQLLLPSLASALPYIQAGKMRGLAVTSRERSPLAPELPTAAEAGIPGFALDVWWGLACPASLPAPVVARLNRELNAVVTSPEVAELLAREAAQAHPGPPEQFGRTIAADLARWTRLVKDHGITTE